MSDGGNPPLHARYGPEALAAVQREAALPTTAHEREIARGLELGLPGADSIVDRSHPHLLPRRAAALRRHQHLPQGPVPGGRAPLRRVRRRGDRRPVRRGHHLPLRHPVRPAGHPEDLRAVRAVQLRAGRRPARVDHDRRPGRRLHHPGQHREDVRPDQQGGLARLRERRVPGGARRRPLDRLPDHPRRRPAPERRQSRDHPLRPARGHPGDRPRRADAHHALVPRHGHPQRAGPQPGADRHRRVAGARGPGSRSAASAAPRC